MKIKTFEVVGLMGRDAPLRLNFNEDLNIITGRNGSGKTTVLKLLWYILSGNILLALKEVNFQKATLITDLYQCTVIKEKEHTCRVEWKDSNGEKLFEDEVDGDGDVYSNAEDEADVLLSANGSSVFLPTFRRIEGGFGLSDRATPIVTRTKNDIEDSLVALSRRLTQKRHVFVTAVSTVDVANLLIRKFTDLSEEYNNLQMLRSREIIDKIKSFKRDNYDANLLGANRTLDDIRMVIEGMEKSREQIMRPIEAVRDLVMKLFKHTGIRLGRSLSFGDTANAINSDSLSAGEKQMLSFIVYNAFYSEAVVVIDEPELSLHVDWQRQLFPILLGQQASNQFVIATHSPFIYSKYPEKELQIDPERGDEE